MKKQKIMLVSAISIILVVLAIPLVLVQLEIGQERSFYLFNEEQVGQKASQVGWTVLKGEDPEIVEVTKGVFMDLSITANSESKIKRDLPARDSSALIRLNFKRNSTLPTVSGFTHIWIGNDDFYFKFYLQERNDGDITVTVATRSIVNNGYIVGLQNVYSLPNEFEILVDYRLNNTVRIAVGDRFDFTYNVTDDYVGSLADSHAVFAVGGFDYLIVEGIKSTMMFNGYVEVD